MRHSRSVPPRPPFLPQQGEITAINSWQYWLIEQCKTCTKRSSIAVSQNRPGQNADHYSSALSTFSTSGLMLLIASLRASALFRLSIAELMKEVRSCRSSSLACFLVGAPSYDCAMDGSIWFWPAPGFLNVAVARRGNLGGASY